MRKSTFKLIRRIAQRDQKSRTEVALKISEEVGEIAKAVLIEQAADGTDYRDEVTNEDLAEEMADVIICVVALAEKYNIPDKQLDIWLHKKTGKWLSVIRAEGI